MQQNRQIYLLRHGEISRPLRETLIGQQERPLTTEGIRQMERAARFLATQKEIGQLTTSPLSRCIEGGRIIGQQLKLAPSICHAFAEINLGDWDGLTRKDIDKEFPGSWQERGANPAVYRPPGGESFNDLHQRVIPAFTHITDNLKKDIVIIAHAGVNRVILASVLQIPLKNIFTIKQQYGCINILQSMNGKMTVDQLNFLPE